MHLVNTAGVLSTVMITQEDLERMQAVDLATVNPEELTDLRDIHIDTGKSVPEKIRQFISQTNNLFVNRFGDYVVKVSYTDTDVTVNDKMKKYIARLAEVTY